MHLARLRIRRAIDAAQYVEHLVGAEHRRPVLRMPEGAARRQAEHQLMDLVGRRIDVVVDETGGVVAPQEPGHALISDVGRLGEGRAR